MAIDFRIGEHSVRPGVRIVEILVDGKTAGVIYPDDTTIKIVSAHMGEMSVETDFTGEVVKDDGSQGWPPIPSVLITFNPSPYVIVGNRIVKIRPS